MVVRLICVADLWLTTSSSPPWTSSLRFTMVHVIPLQKSLLLSTGLPLDPQQKWVDFSISTVWPSVSGRPVAEPWLTITTILPRVCPVSTIMWGENVVVMWPCIGYVVRMWQLHGRPYVNPSNATATFVQSTRTQRFSWEPSKPCHVGID